MFFFTKCFISCCSEHCITGSYLLNWNRLRALSTGNLLFHIHPPSAMSTDSKHPRDGNHDQGVKSRKIHHPTDARRSAGPRSFASAAAINDAGSKRHSETQSATKPGTEIEGKAEQRPAKPRQENHTPSTTSEESHHHEHERPHDPQPSTTESAPKKSLPGDPAQHLRRRSTRGLNSQTVAPLPVGAAPAECFDGSVHQDLQSTVVTITSTSHRISKAANNTPDVVRAATPSVPDPQPEVTAGVVAEQTTVTAAPADVRPRALPEVGQGEESRIHPDSEATLTNAVAQDGGLASGMLGGIANALGMRPPTAKEIRLEKDIHRLKEENKILRTENHTFLSTARRYHHDAIRFHHENQRLQETLEAMSLEIKGVTKRYEEAKLLSETRGKELLGAQVFLTKADGLSISELIQKVDGLNDEIYQAAASLGESIIQKKVEPSEQTQTSSDVAKALLGSSLCKVLRTRAKKSEEGINPLLVQITLQTFFSVFLINRIRCWIPVDLAFDSILEQLYQKIWSSSERNFLLVLHLHRSHLSQVIKPSLDGGALSLEPN